eukprot:gene22074-28169_t
MTETRPLQQFQHGTFKQQHDTGSTVDKEAGEIHKHCKSRQHEALCRALFSRISSECVDEADGWVGEHAVVSAHSPLYSLLHEKLESPLTVRHLDHRSVTLKLSDVFSVRISMSQVKTTATSSTQHLPWLQHALQCCLINAQRCLHDSSLVASRRDGAARRVEDVRVSRNRAGLAGAASKVGAQTDKESGVRFARPLLRLLTAKIHQHRVRCVLQSASARCVEWGGAVTRRAVNRDKVQSADQALSEHWRYVLSLQEDVVLSVDADSSSAALATVTTSTCDVLIGGGQQVLGPVLNELRSAGERGLNERVLLDTVDELQTWVERAVMTAHFRSSVKSVVDKHPSLEVVSASPFSFDVQAREGHVSSPLASVRLGQNIAVGGVVLDLTVNSPTLAAALKTRLQSLCVNSSGVALVGSGLQPVGDVDAMDVEEEGAAQTVTAAVRRAILRINL